MPAAREPAKASLDGLRIAGDVDRPLRTVK
jgi:hypothetical protein